MKVAAVLIAALWSSQAIACAPAANALKLTSEGEVALDAYLTLDDLPLSEPFDMGLLLCGDTVQIERVDVAAIMPAHQHGMNYEPVVKAVGNGAFEVSGMVFHMPGVWQVQVSIYGEQEPAFFNLEVEAR
ncbi:FixH family protein [Planktotalea sp.]|uniref:FixH family protein n=1 Tax=Planktotalea sp. TaxID=2029877 RepID=UPI0032982342